MADLPKVAAALAHASSAEPGLVPEALVASPWAQAAQAAAAHAPYLARLMRRRADLLDAPDAEWPARLLQGAINDAHTIAREPPDIAIAMRTLRRAKDGAHLAIAIADLARAWPLERVTRALTDFADAALSAAIAVAARETVARGDFVETGADGHVPGLALIAMGKMGAHELNYSSDIDVSVFFDAARLPVASGKEARVVAVRLVAPLVRVLQEVDADGYVLRIDLRLRPDPSSTPPAVSIAAAENYYQTLGQNWERAAFIKARAASGDIACGEQFLDDLQAFIWRKHLDFAAVADVQSIKRQILSAHGGAELDEAVFNVKLGRGGIRDIELFAQTQQLILGGRNPDLRQSGTLAALAALAQAEAISADARDRLTEAYVFFREVEHRIQMLEDAQTHDVPEDGDARARLAALCGFAVRSEFEAAIIARRKIVSGIDHQLFGAAESLAAPEGSLIFTGVEDRPETLDTIRKLGYANPASVSQTIRGWHHGRIPAMRSERARELLTALTPQLLRAFAGGGDPNQAFARFAAFFSGLSAGVQVLSLMTARPALLEMLARLFGLAPVLAETLSRRPILIDAMIEPHFSEPLTDDAPGARLAALRTRLDECESFEEKINAARRFKRDEAYRIGVQVLEGAASAAAAGAAHADLAESCMAAMTEAALEEVARMFGPQPGAVAVLALGKFGGRELAEGSDLDIMVVHDAPDAAGEASGHGLSPHDYYTRFTQRLISALSAQTEEGALYEVDMQLRPSGSKGPVAVRLTSFERYYSEEAWTWELQALTRLRPVAGDADLGARVSTIAKAALMQQRDRAKTLGEVADMRARMERERPAKSDWDMKLAPGGLVDVEFIAQALQLVCAADAPAALSPNTGAALAQLAEAGALDQTLAAELRQAFTLYSDLQQALRVCGADGFDPALAPQALRTRLSAIAGVADFAALEARLGESRALVRRAFIDIVGAMGDGSAPLSR